MIVNTSKIKKAIKKAGFRISGDFCEHLSRRTVELIGKALTNCKNSKKKTLSPEHLESIVITYKTEIL